MTDTRPPRWAERLLESLGANPAFIHDVLGDMTDEFARRVAYDGDDAARRWYLREAWRTLPYVLRDGLRMERRDLVRIGHAVMGAYAVIATTGLVMFSALAAALELLGFRSGSFPDSVFHIIRMPMVTVLGTGLAVFGGYLAARFDKQRPMVSAMALGGFWAAIGLVVGTVAIAAGLPSQSALEVVARALLIVSSTTAGGVIRVCGTPPRVVSGAALLNPTDSAE